MSDVKITTLLDGVPRFIRQLQLANEATRARVKEAVKRGAQRVAADARNRAPKVTGEMAATIRDEYSSDGMVGFVKVGYGQLPRRSRASTEEGKKRFARIRAKREANALQFALATNSRQALSVADLGVYAPVVERGDPRRHHKPHPFMIPALDENRQEIIADIDRAMAAGAKEAGLT